MPYYEFFIYASRKRRLTEIQETLVNLWEFDPKSISVVRTAWTWDGRLASLLLSAIGLPDRKTWLMTITGPEIHRERAYTVAAAWEAICDGGGYDFSYDPYAYYSKDQVRVHTVEWERRNQEAMNHYLDDFDPDERERIVANRRKVLGFFMEAQDNDED